MADSVTATITAQNTFTGLITPKNSNTDNGGLAISISGLTDSTVTLRRSFDHGANWFSVATFTADIQTSLIEIVQGIDYDIGIVTGDYGTDTVIVTLCKKV